MRCGCHAAQEPDPIRSRKATLPLRPTEPHQLLCDAQTQAATLVASGGAGVDLMKGRKDVILPVGGDADTVVGDLDPGHLFVSCHADFHHIARTGELGRVRDEINQNLRDARTIGQRYHLLIRRRDTVTNTKLFSVDMTAFNRRRDNFIKVRGSTLYRDFTFAQGLGVQNVINQHQQAITVAAGHIEQL